MPWLEKLRETLNIPILYVTHSDEEVMRFADRVVMLKAGRKFAEGSVEDVFARNRTLTSIPAEILERDEEGHRIHVKVPDLGGAEIWIAAVPGAVGSTVLLDLSARERVLQD